MPKAIQLTTLHDVSSCSAGEHTCRTIFDVDYHVASELGTGPVHLVVETAESSRGLTTVAYAAILQDTDFYSYSLNSPRFYIRNDKASGAEATKAQHATALESEAMARWWSNRIYDIQTGSPV